MTGPRTAFRPRPSLALAADGTPWQQLAACRSISPTTMFPSNERDGRAVAAAKAFCAVCPVRDRCLAAALAEEDGHNRDRRSGIRGGLTSTERVRLAAAQRRATRQRSDGREPAPCGTAAAYERHIRNGEPVDDACRTARAAQRQANRKRSKAAAA
ncbi:WhiB family transcriptional regulator [Streptomyces tremellae]|uniref:4Fe-4S Wbl-type domain-containing protein n=1 Tax=Streptomyces tremellae TaxID=1124239 RepID=A0ABP7EGR7_9ACTN